MTTEHFVIKDGVLRWIKDMPEKPWTTDRPFKGFPKWAPSHEEIDAYEQALQSAIDSAEIRVDNHPEVFDRCYKSAGIIEEGRVYSLNCRVEVKDKPFNALENGRGVINFKPVAFVTFPSENKELGEAERVESDLNEMFDTKRIIDFAVWYSGMDRSKVVSAYKRYINEKLSKPVTPTDNDDTKI